MVTTVRDIITDAYRLGGIIGLNETVEDPLATFALSGLQSMLKSWITSGLFGTMADVFTSVDYTAKENERISVDDAVVTIPDTFIDYTSGGVRAPAQLAAIVVVTNSATFSYIYDRRQWTAIETLALADTCPLAEFGERGLASALAIELCSLPALSGTVTQGMDKAARAFNGAITQSRLSSFPVRSGENFRPRTSYIRSEF